MIVTVILIPVCVLTVWEGGFYMLPALVTLLAIDAIEPGPREPLPRAARP
jgi:hypothetical protein